MSNKNRRKPRIAKKATVTSPNAGDDPASTSCVAEQLDPHIDAQRSGESVSRPPERINSPLSVCNSLAPTDFGGDVTSESRAEVNATMVALMTEADGVWLGDDTDDDQLVMPSGNQGVVFPAQREGASFSEHPLNILGPELFRRGPSPRISMLVDPRIPSVGATGSQRPSMVASLKRLSSWSTDRWAKADQELVAFTDEITGALAQVTKSNRALQVKLDTTEFVLSGQNNVSSVFSYAMGSGSSYAVIPSPAPSIESLLVGPVSRVPSKDGSASPRSFLIDRASGRAEGTVQVPETPFLGPDTTDANIMALVSHLGDDHCLPNKSALEYERHRAAAQRMARVQSTPFIERGRHVEETVPRMNDDGGMLPAVPPGLALQPVPHQFANGRRGLSGPPGLPNLPNSRGFTRDGPPHQVAAKELVVIQDQFTGILPNPI
ncbi:hypothetical protein JAAARDRAFT_187414 [Jaapia argillacea MUCL 33604]|uniref:Uncharacterized protein n=1 Tax=Jaapia argillacea MUCL 33604 TaxID=933084 RepID=A0A067QN28_9AGAM|nr:hypothetical protein JAAARDRAFT_187414 [Jaapia argillacea MUCL 33604]